MKTLLQHPLSAAFPAMGSDDYQSLKDSIESIGVQNPITLFEDMVIDGWHRYMAATQVGVICPMVELGDVDPRDFVLAQNKARRHITQAQLAMATTSVYAWAPIGNPQLHTECAIGKTSAQMAEIAGVHRNTIVQAQAVQTKAAPEVIAAVKAGEIGLPKAAKIAQLPKEEQAAAIAKPIPKDAPEPALEVVHDDGPDEAEMAALVAAQLCDVELVQKMLDADDALAYVTNELAKTRAQLDAMTASRNGYQNQCAELIKMIKSKDRQIAKLQQVQA